MQNSVPSIRITSLYASQPLSVLLCMQNSDFWTSIQVSMDTRHPLSFCACKTSGLAPELLVPMGSNPHLCFFHAKQGPLDQDTSLYGFQNSHVVLCMQTACLASELLVCMVPRPHLWILTAKQRLLDQHTSLYGYQTSPVVLCMQNSVISTRITSLYGSLPSTVVFACKTVTFGPDLKVPVVPRHDLSFGACTTA